MLNKVLNKIKEIIGIEKSMILRFWLMQMLSCEMRSYNNTEVVIIMTYVIKDGNKFYLQLF